MRHHVCHAEGKEKPDGRVAPEVTVIIEMMPRQAFYETLKWVGKEQQKTKIYDTAYASPYKIRSEQSLETVFQVRQRLTRSTLVEIACLEEEKGHEEERPSHHLGKPKFISITTATYHMKQYHAKDAESAQKVKSMIATFHLTFLPLQVIFLNRNFLQNYIIYFQQNNL